MVQKLTGDIRLESVIRIIPWTLFKVKGSQKIPNSPKKRYAKWKETLAQVGLESIEPIEVGSFYASVSQLNEEVLQYIEASSRHIHPDKLWESFGDGGEALLHNEDVLFTPTCCSDIGSLAGWENVAKHRQADWMMVWIGHPWTNAKYEKGWLYFTDYTQGDADKAKLLYAIKPEKIAQAVKRAKPETEAFLERYKRVFGRG